MPPPPTNGFAAPLPTAVRLWGPVVLWAGLIFAFSSIPSLGTGLGGWDLLLRKLAHATVFGILALLLVRATGRPLLALGITIAYAITDETHQLLVPGREGSPRDVLIDSAGAVIALAAAWKLTALRRASA